MDFKKEFDNLENLNKQMEGFNKMINQAYSKLDPESYEKVKQHHIDTNAMIREFRKGNTNAVDNLINKYLK
jgi:hypothetical protein